MDARPALSRRTAATVISALALLLIWGCMAGPLRGLEHGLRDAALRSLATQTPPSTPLLVVDIDEASLAEVGAWPWPRSTLADLVEQLLGEHGARAVGLDMVFPERRDAPGDERLQALTQHAPVVLALAFGFSPEHQALRAGELPAQAALPAPGDAVTARGYLASHAGLAEAPCAGNIGVRLDEDGVLRRMPLRVAYEANQWPSFAVALLRCADLLPPGKLPAQLVLPYRHRVQAFESVSAADVLAGRVASQQIAGRLVLVGSSAFGLGDRVATPLQAVHPGVYVQAELIDALARPAPPAWRWPSALLLALLGVLVAALAGWPHLASAPPAKASTRHWILRLSLAAAALGLALAGWLLTLRMPQSLPLLPTVLLMAVLALLLLMRTLASTRRALAWLGGHLQLYVAEPVWQKLQQQQQPDDARLGTITVMNVDIAQYSAWSRSLSTAEQARLTWELLERLSQVVDRHGGVLTAYTGDGLMAIWPHAADAGPVPTRQALQAALALLPAFAAWRASLGDAPAGLRLRIGIDEGEAMTGELGTSLRRLYTANGVCVNHAAHLQRSLSQGAQPLALGNAVLARFTVEGLDTLPQACTPRPDGSMLIIGRCFEAAQVQALLANRLPPATDRA